MSDERRVRVELAERSYDVVLRRSGFEPLGELWRQAGLGSRAVVVTDPQVAALHLSAVQASLTRAAVQVTHLEVPVGESAKTITVWSDLVDRALDSGVDRSTVVVALGGGCVGDLSGFLAATLMRGLPFVQLPTTLLSLVDSSVGGKVAVNHALGKNLIGAFHQPALVFGALDALATLPARDFRAGLGEVVKTALLGDVALFERLETLGRIRHGDDALLDVVERCVQIKADVVCRDEHEAGLRAILNTGHTAAHAIETVTRGLIRHGEAVAMGLVWEAEWAVQRGVCQEPDLPGRIRRVCTSLGLEPTPPSLDPGHLVAAMRLDKKGSGDKLLWPAPVRVGQVDLIDLPMRYLMELVRSC